MPSFKKSLIVEQFQGNYLKKKLGDEGLNILRLHLGLSVDTVESINIISDPLDYDLLIVCEN